MTKEKTPREIAEEIVKIINIRVIHANSVAIIAHAIEQERAAKVGLPKSVRGYSLLEFLKLLALLDYDFGRFEDAKELNKSHRIEGVRARYEILNEWIKALELVRKKMGDV